MKTEIKKILYKFLQDGITSDDAAQQVLDLFDVMAMLPSSETIEANGMEGGLRDGELQMFWEGAEWLKSHLQKRLLSKGN